ncbi:MAG: hypothetical protein R3271_02425 [Methylophaga sp.]|nr:hypothetical protein [Methylophaga sp.]MDX1749159.1 hypothetical protein [Methylophaga sp.]
MMLTIEKHGLIINERNDLVKRMRNDRNKKGGEIAHRLFINAR